MNILLDLLELFDEYFLILILIQSFVLWMLDYNYFKRENMYRAARQCKSISFISTIFTVVLYITRMILL